MYRKQLIRALFLLLAFYVLPAANAQQSENVTLLHNWNDTATNVINSTGQRYNDVWGFVQGGAEYAVIGSTMGAHIIDVATGMQVAFALGADTGVNIVHRDYKTFQHYLYAVCDEGESALQVYDLSYLPDSLHLVYQSNPLYFLNCHNIFIDTAKAKLYACSVKGQLSGSDQMRVYSLANPEAPELLTKYNMHAKVHDAYVRNDTAYCSSEFYGLEVVDFSANNDTWSNIGELTTYPYKGYNHSSWINDKGIGVMADETHGLPLKVIDVTNLSDIQVLGHFAVRPDDTTCIPHNPYVIGNKVFISYYLDGLQIYDISNPASPWRAGYYDTYPGPDFKGFAGAWGCYPFLPSGKVLISDMQTGLYVFDASKALSVPAINQAEAISVHPNPAITEVNISLPKTMSGDAILTIFDPGGSLRLTRTVPYAQYANNPIRIPLPGSWASGTYFLRVTASGRSGSAKILKP